MDKREKPLDKKKVAELKIIADDLSTQSLQTMARESMTPEGREACQQLLNERANTEH